MTHRERMLRCIRGQKTDQIPWVPRLDLWYHANKRAGTLPHRFRHASLLELLEELDLGYHAVIPDYLNLRGPEDDQDRALGIYNLEILPCETVLEEVDRTVSRTVDRTHVTYSTPAGKVSTTVLYDDEMRKAGITNKHVEEYPIRTLDDYAAVGHIFSNARAEENYQGYQEYAAHVGDRGIAVAYVSPSASPMHYIQRELMTYETFVYHMFDHPDELTELARQVEIYWQRLTQCALECPADVFLLGANYDADLTYPPFFEQHLLPQLKQYADRLHNKGHYLLSHTDGENRGLLDLYVRAGIDISDSICPSPMTSHTIGQVREALGTMTIMGAIPSVSLLPEAMPNREFDAFLDQFFSDIGQGEHLILSIADTAPPAADFGRILRIGEMVRQFGPVSGDRQPSGGSS